jgi:TolB protein
MHPKPKHITQQLEAYLDNQLSPEERRQVEEHVTTCPDCARRLFDTQRVSAELGSIFKSALGQPHPPAELRLRVKDSIDHQSRRFGIPWAVPGRVLNAAGTVAVIGLLIFGVFTVIRGQLPGADMPTEILSLRPSASGGDTPAAANTPTPVSQAMPAVTPTLALASLGDTLSLPIAGEMIAEKPAVAPPVEKTFERPTPTSVPLVAASLPYGTIAFSIYNSAGNRQVYETHLVSPHGAQHRLFPLDGVSEPALSPDGQYMAYRAWSKPTSPRSLLSSNLEGYTPYRVGGFWEDSLPDWSPTEYRLIYASQRESDRRWRLYTSKGDGSNEINLRREGRNPTFAPDGERFAFESCDATANRCGLWVGNLENAEYESTPFLEDPLAQAPDWSPVGDEIVYMANPNGNWDLYLVNADGRNGRRLTTTPAVEGLPVWSPDGEWLAFLSNRSGEWGIWLLHVDTGDIRQVVELPGATFTPPAGSPYGQRNWWDEQLGWSR